MEADTGASQSEKTDHPGLERADPVVAALIETAPGAVREATRLGEVVDRLLIDSEDGVPVTTGDGRLVGVVTLRALASACLPVHGETAAKMSSLRFLRETAGQLRERLGAVLDKPVAHMIDPYVPEVTPDVSLTEIFFQFFRNNTYLPVIDAMDSRRLVGVIDVRRAVECILERSGAAEPAL